MILNTMRKNRKNIISAAIITALATGINVAFADSLNSLLQMDVKKSSLSNAIDVTFYTTGETANSVVTKKSNNKYIVLLPNTSSSPSVTPNIGGIKDLVTNIDVKHINDGIGGYTKVTFETTQPINIKTHNKKTNPLTQAQKDTQAIIAKNNVENKTTEQAKTNTQATKTVKKEQQKQLTTNTENKTTQKSSTPKFKPISVPSATAPVQKPKQETVNKQKAVTKAQQKQNIVEPKSSTTEKNVKSKTSPKVEKEPINTYVPKMKFDKNGKRIIDLEPRVSHSVVVEKAVTTTPKTDSTFTISEQASTVNQSVNDTAIDTPISNERNTSSHITLLVLVIGGAIATLGILYLVFDAMSQAKEKDQTRLQSFFKLSAQNQAKRRRRDYYDIANNKELSWQEKYKLYTEKEEQRNPKVEEPAVSFITDMSGTKKAITMPDSNSDMSTKNIQSYYKDVVNEKLQAKISKMEHALAQTPKNNEPEEISDEVKSEDNAITNKISEIKLKSFSKPVTLKETQRSLVEEDKKISRNKSYKEGKFVKLKNSPLSVNRRKSSISDLEVSDLIGTGSKYLTNNGEMKMNKENENYLVSSLNEYISILDSEERSTTIAKSSVADTLSQIKSSAQAMSRSGMTNPMMSRETNPISQTISKSSVSMNGLIVKSGYNIDSEKGFYVVNIDGVSNLVGRIKDDIFVLKKFDYVVDKPIQVRQDHGNVYIVRVGKFKCLVDVAQDKMGTLIEI